MTEHRYNLECLGEDVVMVVDGQRVMFEGWDEEAEEAYLALGGEESLCYTIADALNTGDMRLLNEKLQDAIMLNEPAMTSLLIAAGADLSDDEKENLIWMIIPWGYHDVLAVLRQRWPDSFEKDWRY